MDDPNNASEVHAFDLDRSTAEAWSEFSARLADVISHMDPGATLRIGSLATEQEGTSPFVLFRCRRGLELIAEAAGNAALSEEFQLASHQLEALEQFGWNPPNVDSGYPTENYWRAGDQERASELAASATRVLREVYLVPHPAFLAPDQLAEILTPPGAREAPSTTFAPDELIAQLVSGKPELDRLIEAELTELLGHQPLQDADGDFALRVGSTMVFVRATTDAQEVLVFSAVVHDVEGRSRAMEVLSDLNTEARFVRFMLIKDRVFVSLSIFAQPFVPAHLHQALRAVSVVADEIDEHLASKLRGRTTFASDG
ncbi:T3SS (YopN, CesT) and YbjN peptide-binding chaperone 1 [Micropruina sp.]|uniref:T3SS (YopN, CesT) and YbjN peptide-binding chaperone 1 n=1 Tax=Micropruina sp. TaxID=2737536 RepID=UPI0039E2CABB